MANNAALPLAVPAPPPAPGPGGGAFTPTAVSASNHWKDQRFAVEILNAAPAQNATAVRQSLKLAKSLQRFDRRKEEQRLNTLAATNNVAWRTHMQNQRGEQVRGHHASFRNFEAQLPEGYWYGAGQIWHGQTAVANIHFGNDRFEQLAAGPGLAAGQAVYRKRGTDKEYVRDATGNLVKRYVARMDDGAPRTRPTRTSNAIDGRDRQKGFQPAIGTALTIQDKAVMQNLAGGGGYTRALSTTASKYPILSNAGLAFGGAAPVASVFDLAAVSPTDIYKGYDRTDDPALTGVARRVQAGPGWRTFNAQQTLTQFRWSSAKNKEVYLTANVTAARVNLASAVDPRAAAAKRAFPAL